MEKLSSINVQNDKAGKDCRNLANFKPDLWIHRFVNYTLPDQLAENLMAVEVLKRKEVVRKKLTTANEKNRKETLMYIDAIQRLGVAYHFEDEIEDLLQNFHNNDVDSHKNDLHYVSLRFRLLRQHGFRVFPDVLNAFKYDDGKFKDSISSDQYGMLSLYESSNLRVHGEEILDDALAYTSARLASFGTDHPGHHLVPQVAHALKLPLFKRTTRLDSIFQISFYESEPSRDETLLTFAKLDFNLLQVLHIRELKDIIGWSNSLSLYTKLPFSRERLAEGYLWTLDVYYEPKYSKARILLNKFFKIISIIDDIYDAYGTFKELQLFTEAIQRWDKIYGSLLPEYMRFFYEVTLDTFKEFEKELALEGRSYAGDYLCQEIKASCEAYMQEAKWLHEKYVPTFNEYMRNGIESSGYFYLTSATFLGMGGIANIDAYEWIRQSNATKSSCILARVVNDIASHQFEQEREHVASAVECYMHQFGSTLKEANQQLQLIIEDAWKDIKHEMLRTTGVVPTPLFTRVLNLARAMHEVYDNDEDGYTMNQLLKPKIEATLLTPIP